MNRWMKRVLTTAGVVIGALGLVGTGITIRHGRPRAYYIPSAAMKPTLCVGDRVIAGTKLGIIERGDIVVFKMPPTRPGGPELFIKRVVAIGGDHVEFKNDQLWLNGKPADEDYLAPGTRTLTRPDTAAVDVPDDAYFVMGDNRMSSADSRAYGPIDRDAIVGKRLWTIGTGNC